MLPPTSYARTNCSIGPYNVAKEIRLWSIGLGFVPETGQTTISLEATGSVTGTKYRWERNALYGFKNLSSRLLGGPYTYPPTCTREFNGMSEPLALLSVFASVISLSGTVLSKSVSVRDTIDLLRARWKRKVKVSGLQNSVERVLTRYWIAT